MVDAVRWNDVNNSLAAVADGSLMVWYYPEVVYLDRDLLPSTLSRQPVRPGNRFSLSSSGDG